MVALATDGLVETIETLKKFVKFNVADFGGHVRVMIPRRLVTVSSARSSARSWAHWTARYWEHSSARS